MASFLWLVPLLAISATGKVISTQPSKQVLYVMKQFEAGYGAFAVSGNAGFLNATTKVFHKNGEHSCLRSISQCGKNSKDHRDVEQCEGDDLGQGAVSQLLRRLRVTEIRNVNKQYIEKSYTNFNNVQQTKWELSNGKKTMTCDVEFKVNQEPSNYPDISMIRLVCDSCKF